MTIHEWLRNPSDFETGRQLYDKYGTLQALKKAFARGELYDNLVYELGKIAEGMPEVISVNPFLERALQSSSPESKEKVKKLLDEDDLIIIENERDEAIE